MQDCFFWRQDLLVFFYLPCREALGNEKREGRGGNRGRNPKKNGAKQIGQKKRQGRHFLHARRHGVFFGASFREALKNDNNPPPPNAEPGTATDCQASRRLKAHVELHLIHISARLCSKSRECKRHRAARNTNKQLAQPSAGKKGAA
jgi:hypothetical protein